VVVESVSHWRDYTRVWFARAITRVCGGVTLRGHTAESSTGCPACGSAGKKMRYYGSGAA
jgi:hypothetical protein